jgi:cytochrome b involved in lipid metabolism
MKKYIAAVIGLALLLGVLYTVFNADTTQAPTSQTNSQTQTTPINQEVVATSSTETNTPEKPRLAVETGTQMATGAVAPTAAVKSVASGTYTLADIQTHNTEQSCYSAINGNVYDLTDWINKHPGGKMAIMFICGKDGTNGFMGKHAQSEKAKAALAKYKIGTFTQ